MKRRTFIHGIGMTGLSLPFLNVASAATQPPKAKSVINIFLSGGLSQYDSFNMEVDPSVIANSKDHREQRERCPSQPLLPDARKAHGQASCY